jgi:hypothetical protein
MTAVLDSDAASLGFTKEYLSFRLIVLQMSMAVLCSSMADLFIALWAG